MRHWHIDVTIDEGDIKVIKDQFLDFFNEAEGFSLEIHPLNSVELSPELEATVKKMFIRLLMAVHYGKFKGIN